MRPKNYYAVYNEGKVTHICHGAADARKIYNGRGYRAFKTQLAAEEHAAWWNYLDPITKQPRITRLPHFMINTKV